MVYKKFEFSYTSNNIAFFQQSLYDPVDKVFHCVGNFVNSVAYLKLDLQTLAIVWGSKYDNSNYPNAQYMI